MIDALAQVVAVRDDTVGGAILHYDRGSPVTARAMAQIGVNAGLCRSMGPTEICWDNSAADSW